MLVEHNTGTVVGCQRSVGKSFAMESCSELVITTHGILGDRVLATFKRPDGALAGISEPLTGVITHRNPEHSQIIQIGVTMSDLGDFRFKIPGVSQDPHVAWAMAPGPKVPISIFNLTGEGVYLGDEVSRLVSMYLRTECIVVASSLDVRAVKEKHLPKEVQTDVQVHSSLNYQDGTQITLVAEEEIHRFNQVMRMWGLSWVCDFRHWRMNVLLRGIHDLYSVKELQIGDIRLYITHPCQRCPGMNTNPFTGIQSSVGPYDYLKWYGWRGEALFSSDVYQYPFFERFRSKKEKGHQPFFGVNAVVVSDHTSEEVSLRLGSIHVGDRVQVLQRREPVIL